METSTTTPTRINEVRKERFEAKSRVHDWGLSITPEPTEPRCSDPSCKSWYCQNGHPEVDHKVWNLWKTREIKARRDVLVPIVAQHLEVREDQVKLRFSSKAGCSCGCSPGWVLERPWSNFDLHIHFD